jgi:hypothetical protein
MHLDKGLGVVEPRREALAADALVPLAVQVLQGLLTEPSCTSPQTGHNCFLECGCQGATPQASSDNANSNNNATAPGQRSEQQHTGMVSWKPGTCASSARVRLRHSGGYRSFTPGSWYFTRDSTSAARPRLSTDR